MAVIETDINGRIAEAGAGQAGYSLCAMLPARGMSGPNTLIQACIPTALRILDLIRCDGLTRVQFFGSVGTTLTPCGNITGLKIGKRKAAVHLWSLYIFAFNELGNSSLIAFLTSSFLNPNSRMMT